MNGSVSIKKLEGPALTIPLCLDSAGKRLQLVRFENPSKNNAAVITVNPGNRRFGVPPGGIFHCVMCDGAFVQSVPTLWNWGKARALVRDGRMCYTFDRESASGVRERCEPIYPGFFGLDFQGNVRIGEYRFPCGEHGAPVVSIRDGIGVDAEGLLTIPLCDRAHFPEGYRFLQASDRGQLCILGDRRVLCRGKLILNGDRCLDACTCDRGYLVLTLEGDALFSSNGVGWQLLEAQAVAIAGGENTIAIADSCGTLYLYQSNDRSLFACGKLTFPGRCISEIAVSDETVMVKFSDCAFDIIDWKSGKTCLDDRVFPDPRAEDWGDLYD